MVQASFATPSARTGARQVYGLQENRTPTPWQVPEEVPVALVYNGVSHAVMMATPLDLEDFAIGFSLAEGLVAAVGAIEDVEVLPHPAGLMVALSVAPVALLHDSAPVRAMAGRSGCGLCGVESLEHAIRPVIPLPTETQQQAALIPSSAIAAAMATLADHQPLNQQTFSVHAAAWCRPDGTIEAVREDVGRHNALDKLIGAVTRAGGRLDQGFVLTSSRCSFELVQKAAAVGVGLLASLSAPTALALDLAAHAGMILASRAAGGTVMVFTDGTAEKDQ